MKLSSLLENADSKKLFLYEGLSRQDVHSVKLWENAGQYIAEANLTANQVQQLFQQIEQGATAGGSNRTALGLGKDATVAVKNAYNDLKTKVQNSGPMKNADAMYDQAAEKLKQATGGDAGVMKYVQKYRDFAKAHPIAQSLIYSALIAAAGISGVGVGGAAALGLLKMTDKLLQGEKFSSAAIAGAETGALAYGASQLGQAVQNAFNPTTQTGTLSWSSNNMYSQAKMVNGKVVGEIMLNNQVYGPDSPQYAQAVKIVMQKAAEDHMTGSVSNFVGHGSKQVANMGSDANFGGFKESALLLGTQLSERQIRVIFRATQGLTLQEGVWDSIKGAAAQAGSAIANKAKTVGHNLTTKITADKLNKAWNAAGAPTDSNELAQFLTNQGVDKSVIDSVYQQLSLPVVQSQAGQPAPAAVDINNLKARIMKLDANSKQALLTHLLGTI